MQMVMVLVGGGYEILVPIETEKIASLGPEKVERLAVARMRAALERWRTSAPPSP